MRWKPILTWLAIVMAAVSFAGAQTTVTTSGGTVNSIPIYTGSSTVGNSPISVGSNGYLGMFTTSPNLPLTVNGGAQFNFGVLGEFFTAQAGSLTATMPASLQSTVGPEVVLINGYKSGSGVATKWLMANMTGNYGNTLQFWDYDTTGCNPGGMCASRLTLMDNGNIGIGTQTPGAALEVNGSVKLTSGSGASITFQDGTVQSTAYTGVSCGGDYAESVDVTGDRTKYSAGDVLVIDPDSPGKFLKSAEPYSTSVTGIYSTKPGTLGRRQTTPKSPDEVPMAMVGIVPTKVSAENGPIHPGDLLVSASTFGYAMRGTDRGRMLGAVIGKALGNLDSGTGVIEVVVTLQ